MPCFCIGMHWHLHRLHGPMGRRWHVAYKSYPRRQTLIGPVLMMANAINTTPVAPARSLPPRGPWYREVLGHWYQVTTACGPLRTLPQYYWTIEASYGGLGAMKDERHSVVLLVKVFVSRKSTAERARCNCPAKVLYVGERVGAKMLAAMP